MIDLAICFLLWLLLIVTEKRPSVPLAIAYIIAIFAGYHVGKLFG